MGGIGVMELAMKHPDRFAAIAPVCGRCENIGNINKIDEANLHIWVIYAENDEKKILTEGSKEIIERLKNTKHFHQLKRMNHNLKKSEENPNRSVNHIEERIAAFADPELYQWFLGISNTDNII
jgi:predicted peptidase